eukprot:CAMPEP_0180087988 /NCGR_PEP_ID=MMETSP0985-20121206/22022_1 /TAXON_ID=483367 /ORGANISM="non described non described, Strain CCMP 2436" /LENGTH=235 /DNA_ID=CAMNT_0022022421 /DNA_START=16 /DNA_END=723 /DNA_ORIENTATION=+
MYTSPLAFARTRGQTPHHPCRSSSHISQTSACGFVFENVQMPHVHVGPVGGVGSVGAGVGVARVLASASLLAQARASGPSTRPPLSACSSSTSSQTRPSPPSTRRPLVSFLNAARGSAPPFPFFAAPPPSARGSAGPASALAQPPEPWQAVQAVGPDHGSTAGDDARSAGGNAVTWGVAEAMAAGGCEVAGAAGSSHEVSPVCVFHQYVRPEPVSGTACHKLSSGAAAARVHSET